MAKNVFQRKEGGFIAAYFVLLLFSASGLLMQGSTWLFAGLISWFGVISICFLAFSINAKAKKGKQKILYAS